ncbi:peptidyl-lys metalloendopeptidase [Rhizoctonia solani AG-3 Rhs1AP]|uniref:Peptidyl-lys metalloendopeptidase n=2 Tax=Rhizoctonia solani AG-3 TaxID=1086053 RepID=A0A074RTG4_9AGAM|nr:peptidyl-lys metalloendopeptidase [Rhizoctonia solani AG-3 Rhs1AP]KEP50159.1 peptidyl-lys metalloendopeptidase [Rhizoctonia solani 123E]
MFAAATFVLSAAFLVSAGRPLSLKHGTRLNNSSLTNDLAAEVQMQERFASSQSALDHFSASPLRKHALYVHCDANQIIQIVQAFKIAQKYADSSYNHLKSNPSGSDLYTKWFGSFDTDRYNRVLKSFNRLRVYPSQFTYKCTCTKQKVISKVKQHEYGIVNLCPNFWILNVDGIYSRAFSIIREGTRFSKVLGTHNHNLTYAGSMTLAVKSPTKAIYNANNHAYFSLDTHT